MKKYKITYDEGNNTNLSETYEADNLNDALVQFKILHPGATYTKTEIVE